MDASSTMKSNDTAQHSHETVLQHISLVLPILTKRIRENPCPDDIESVRIIQEYLNQHQGSEK